MAKFTSSKLHTNSVFRSNPSHKDGGFSNLAIECSSSVRSHLSADILIDEKSLEQKKKIFHIDGNAAQNS